mmetsp:Transcript_15212/g.19979  ORF Transcript_15212/g.19979 Transcript_15212/m.19979 type:complete len:352 (+) Transcript_15212:152-1207(+)
MKTMKRRGMVDPMLSKLLRVKPLGPGPMDTPNPFLFCVYHKDKYPGGNENLGVPNRVGNGMDFSPDAEYRMYHGKNVPGFPQHPHRGFETITATIEGVIDHTDSLGNCGRYGHGDLQWMTAGKGIVHGENFPLVNIDGDNPLRFFQIWLNLPKVNKMVEPDFVMHWENEIKRWKDTENKFSCTIWAGSFGDIKACVPTRHSWANNEENEVGIFHVSIGDGGYFELPKCKGGADINRTVYLIEGKQAKINGYSVERKDKLPVMIDTDGNGILAVEAPAGELEVLVLQGKPIDEPIAQHGPFVMNTREEIVQAFADYQKDQFGGWPWDMDAVVFPRSKGRFAKIGGKEIVPQE